MALTMDKAHIHARILEYLDDVLQPPLPEVFLNNLRILVNSAYRYATGITNATNKRQLMHDIVKQWVYSNIEDEYDMCKTIINRLTDILVELFNDINYDARGVTLRSEVGTAASRVSYEVNISSKVIAVLYEKLRNVQVVF